MFGKLEIVCRSNHFAGLIFERCYVAETNSD
jgi:hypothetical protein